jgi:hypothetical protein
MNTGSKYLHGRGKYRPGKERNRSPMNVRLSFDELRTAPTVALWRLYCFIIPPPERYVPGAYDEAGAPMFKDAREEGEIRQRMIRAIQRREKQLSQGIP